MSIIVDGFYYLFDEIWFKIDATYGNFSRYLMHTSGISTAGTHLNRPWKAALVSPGHSVALDRYFAALEQIELRMIFNNVCFGVCWCFYLPFLGQIPDKLLRVIDLHCNSLDPIWEHPKQVIIIRIFINKLDWNI